MFVALNVGKFPADEYLVINLLSSLRFLSGGVARNRRSVASCGDASFAFHPFSGDSQLCSMD
jgi:hypothetical protein